MNDTIGKLKEYAHLVPKKYKNYYKNIDRYGFKIEGLRILRDHHLVPHELRNDLVSFIDALEYSNNNN